MSILSRIALLLALVLASGRLFANPAVLIFAPEQKVASQEFVDALLGALERTAPALAVKQVQSLPEGTGDASTLIVAVGSQAFQTGLQQAKSSRVIAVLVPRSGYEKILQSFSGRQSSAVFLDQTEERQLALISLLPGPPGNVGVIRASSDAPAVRRLRASAQKFRLKLTEASVTAEHDLAQAVQSLIGESDVILATPDPAVFNPQTIQSILLSSYRARIPLIGFSPAYTKAGALLSVHSSVRQLADQTAEMVRQTMLGNGLPSPQSPQNFEVSINRQVARSMGIELPTEGVLADWLRNRERQP